MSDNFQDLMTDNHCWGCGDLNPDGLQIKSQWSIPGEESVATFTPRPEHMAGPTDVLYGGIIGALIDCHSICSAIAHRYHVEGREIGQGERIWYVTGTLTVKYRKPTPLDQPVNLSGRVVDFTDKRTNIECELTSGGEVTATGLVVAIRVPSDWKMGQ